MNYNGWELGSDAVKQLEHFRKLEGPVSILI